MSGVIDGVTCCCSTCAAGGRAVADIFRELKAIEAVVEELAQDVGAAAGAR